MRAEVWVCGRVTAWLLPSGPPADARLLAALGLRPPGWHWAPRMVTGLAGLGRLARRGSPSRDTAQLLLDDVERTDGCPPPVSPSSGTKVGPPLGGVVLRRARAAHVGVLLRTMSFGIRHGQEGFGRAAGNWASP